MPNVERSPRLPIDVDTKPTALTVLRRALYHRLADDATLVNWLKGEATRITARRRLAPATYPAITFYDFGVYPYLAQSGRHRLRDSIFTFDVWSQDPEERDTIADQVAGLLQNGVITPSDTKLVRVQSCQVTADRLTDQLEGDLLTRSLDVRVIAYLAA